MKNTWFKVDYKQDLNMYKEFMIDQKHKSKDQVISWNVEEILFSLLDLAFTIKVNWEFNRMKIKTLISFVDNKNPYELIELVDYISSIDIKIINDYLAYNWNRKYESYNELHTELMNFRILEFDKY